ncbi:unnamed protein product [Amoebophrya sp. A25]|nr:unnamed protein product [Amoebophrya sp. A25]|eukprot:GSA25T00022204001.1
MFSKTSYQAVPHQKMPSSSADPFRAIFLQMVDAAIKKTPDADSLTELLRITSPEFSAEKAGNQAAVKKAVKALQLRLHPDKHDGDKKATELFQQLERFCAAAEKAAKAGPAKKRRTSAVASAFPKRFHCFENWNALGEDEVPTLVPTGFQSSEVALKVNCANLRGQIAHNRELSDDQIFSTGNKFTGEVVTLQSPSPEMIKTKLMKGGPVVSESFSPSREWLSSNKVDMFTADNNSERKETFPVIIVGWEEGRKGRSEWVVYVRETGSQECKDVQVAFASKSIENRISLVPQEALEDIKWRAEEPYFELAEAGKKWYHDSAWSVSVDPSKDAKKLHELLSIFAVPEDADEEGDDDEEKKPTGMYAAIENEKEIQVHAPGKRSRSRSAILSEFIYEPKTKRVKFLLTPVEEE